MTRVDEGACLRAHGEHCEIHHRTELQQALDQIEQQRAAGLLTWNEYAAQLLSLPSISVSAL